ncbi:MAG: NAD(P)/FAD-dependent oxidoreductase [Candidatus Lokiarchaeota archaeon]|nr:NAD(P)/FAD-dependent oxidoreductase [Candidatus Lokiarchaeota archaeon]
MTAETHDICIVGAGPAGSIAAERLARAGARVLLLDSQRFPRYKCCAAGVLWHDVEDFPEIKPVIETYNHAMAFHSPSLKHEFSIRSDDHYLLGQTYRAQLDDHLARLAEKAGAEFRQGQLVTGVELLGDRRGAVLAVKDKASGNTYDVTSRLVIGADGVKSIVRKSHPDFAPWSKADLLIASELDVPMGEQRVLDIYGKDRTTHIFMYFDNLPGYAWIFTKKTSVSIGMGTMLEFEGKAYGGRALADKFKAFVVYLEQKGLLPARVADTSKTSYALIPSVSLKDSVTHGRNSLLAGDAAGAFVSALSGEGIYYSMLSGKYAARVASDALATGDFSPQALAEYPRLWRARLEKELNYQYFAKRYMLEVKRRCEKAVRWGQHDETIRNVMSVFFTGIWKIDRKFMTRLYGHYVRLKVKDLLGMLGERERKKDYA